MLPRTPIARGIPEPFLSLSMPRTVLTDLMIQKLKPTGRQETYWCAKTPNFALRMSQAGTKSFMVMLGKERRRVHLGKWPHKELAAARQEAKTLLLTPEAHKPGGPFEKAFAIYETTYLAAYRPRGAAEVTRLVRKHCAKLLPREITSLTSSDFTAIFDKLKPSEANHLFGVLRTFFKWTDARDISSSPLTKLSKPHREKTRERVLMDAELKAIWNACSNDSFGKLVRTLTLTGQRKGEIAALETSWISHETITFPAAITKNATEHTVPVTALVGTILDYSFRSDRTRTHPNAMQPNDSGRPSSSDSSHKPSLLFPSTKTGEIITGWGQLKTALDKASGVADWTLHDLRRTFATRLAELGVHPHIIERILNHKTGAISAIARVYNRAAYLKEMREAMEAYEAYIVKLCSAA